MRAQSLLMIEILTCGQVAKKEDELEEDELEDDELEDEALEEDSQVGGVLERDVVGTVINNLILNLSEFNQ